MFSEKLIVNYNNINRKTYIINTLKLNRIQKYISKQQQNKPNKNLIKKYINIAKLKKKVYISRRKNFNKKCIKKLQKRKNILKENGWKKNFKNTKYKKNVRSTIKKYKPYTKISYIYLPRTLHTYRAHSSAQKKKM